MGFIYTCYLHIISELRFLLCGLVVYDWFERENRDQGKYYDHQYKLDLTKQQYDEMKSLVSPTGKFINIKTK